MATEFFPSNQLPVDASKCRTCSCDDGAYVTVYCDMCGKSACPKCVSGMHGGHNIRTIDDITPEKRRQLKPDNTEGEKLAQIRQFMNVDGYTTDKHEEKLAGEIENKIFMDEDMRSREHELLSQFRNGDILKTGKIKPDSGNEWENSKREKEMDNNMDDRLALTTDINEDILQQAKSLDESWLIITTILPEYTYEILPERKILSTFRPPRKDLIYAVCPTGDGGVWLSYNYSNTVTLTDAAGTVHQEISYNDTVTDISVAPRTQDIWRSAQGQYPWISPQGQNLLMIPTEQHSWTPGQGQQFWSSTLKDRNSWTSTTSSNLKHERHLWMCSGTNFSILECCTCTSSETPVIRFRTEAQPRCLCVTLDGHIIVGMDGALSKFTKTGELVLCSTDFQSDHTQAVVVMPQRITECPVTQNVAVLDRKWSRDEQQYRGHVKVMDWEFQDVFTYSGSVATQNRRQSFRRHRLFDPIDVKYDSIGNLVVGDRRGRTLHLILINGTGQFTQLLHMDSLPTRAIGIDRSNILWVAFSDYTDTRINTLQYCEKTAL